MGKHELESQELRLDGEMTDREQQLSRQLAAAKRVAEEAMKLMSPDQLADLKHRMDDLEAGGH